MAGRDLEVDLHIGDGQFSKRHPGVALLINEPFAASLIYPAVLAVWKFLFFAFPQLQDSPLGWPQNIDLLKFQDDAQCWAIRFFLAGFAISFSYNLFWIRSDIRNGITSLKKKLKV